MKVGRRRLAAAGAAVMVTGALLSGCGPTAHASKVGKEQHGEPGFGSDEYAVALSFRYVGDSGVNETMNQTLQIGNVAATSLVPVLSFKAVDKNDQTHQ